MRPPLRLALSFAGHSHSREHLPQSAPIGSGLDLRDLDRTADPATDFYRFANGGWLDRNPVPADESSWGVFHEVEQRNLAVLRTLLEESAKQPADDLHRKLGDFYATGMDEAAIEAQGTKPLADSDSL